MRRLRYGIAVLSLLLILVVANALLHSDGNPLNPIAAAAERTQEQPGARFTMSAVYNSAALQQPMTARGRGAYNSETGLSKATLTVDSPEGPLTVESIADDTSFYVGGDEIGGELPEGKEWMKIEPFLGHSREEVALSGSGADSSFDALRRVDGDAQRLGRETVDGVPTQRYRAQLSYDGYAGLLRDEGKDEIADQLEKLESAITTPPTIEAWIDDEGILRRMRMVMTLPGGPGQPPVTTDMEMNLFDIGARPAIAVPDESRVFDATKLVQQQLDAS
ncbi:MAG TPA: hypothetical protein VLK37_08650 [Solirubrobacterales bacterium]|nr:hypothetical protein [Solirubrobacterales bacterium]